MAFSESILTALFLFAVVLFALFCLFLILMLLSVIFDKIDAVQKEKLSAVNTPNSQA